MSKSKWAEIRNSFTDEDGTVFIDGYLTADADEGGSVIAKVKSNGEVEYVDRMVEIDAYAQEVIKEILDEQEAEKMVAQVKKDAIITVQDLIDKLNEVADKSKPIFGYLNINGDTYDAVNIEMVDDTLTDRVDINLTVDD